MLVGSQRYMLCIIISAALADQELTEAVAARTKAGGRRGCQSGTRQFART